jgi:UDP-glucose 4-epimerase
MICMVLVEGGFIGSNLVDKLLSEGHEVIGYDNFSSGRYQFISEASKNKNFSIMFGNILDENFLADCMDGVDFVFHLAAHADVRYNADNPSRVVEQNILGTFTVLESMRRANVKNIVFSSTGSVYGDSDEFPTPEYNIGNQTSIYGASKLAGEALIQSYCNTFDFNAWIFRFVSVLGNRYQHGHVIDFYRSLLLNPNNLKVLGNGLQKKSYMNVKDCVDGMLLFLDSKNKINIYNLGTSDAITVLKSIGIIQRFMGINPMLELGSSKSGWVGDNPYILLNTSKANNEGWYPDHTIEQSIIETLQWLEANKWIL